MYPTQNYNFLLEIKQESGLFEFEIQPLDGALYHE